MGNCESCVDPSNSIKEDTIYIVDNKNPTRKKQFANLPAASPIYLKSRIALKNEPTCVRCGILVGHLSLQPCNHRICLVCCQPLLSKKKCPSCKKHIDSVI